uniref:Uncharacterized protein n=1 Tax=Anguilla anguilla TaxID=7936 RepID=A0A0E9T9H9_ANGAN
MVVVATSFRPINTFTAVSETGPNFPDKVFLACLSQHFFHVSYSFLLSETDHPL